MRPVVLALLECLPVLLGLLPGNQLPQWSDIENYAVVEVKVKMQIGRFAEPIFEVVQFGDELLLAIDFFFDSCVPRKYQNAPGAPGPWRPPVAFDTGSQHCVIYSVWPGPLKSPAIWPPV